VARWQGTGVEIVCPIVVVCAGTQTRRCRRRGLSETGGVGGVVQAGDAGGAAAIAAVQDRSVDALDGHVVFVGVGLVEAREVAVSLRVGGGATTV
jgi:hypothetical protein